MNQVRQHGEYEQSFHAQGEHPGFAGQLTARFEHESGKSRTVRGFYDGDDTYRLRFMPDRTGRWTYQVASDLSLAGERKGEFEVVESDLPGLLHVDSDHPHHLIFANGGRFFPLGNTAYNLIAAMHSVPDEADAFLRYYHERGFNWVRFCVQQVTWDTHGFTLWPWGGTPDAPDYDSYNLDLFRAADQVLDRLGELRTIASVILTHPTDEPRLALAAESPEQALRTVERYIDYAVARFGARWNVVWNLANEWARGGTFDIPQTQRLGRHLHEIDPYAHLTACHDTPRFEFPHDEWTDISSLQHRGLPHEIARNARANRVFGKPVINEEYGYEGDNHSPPNDPVNVRRDHWALTTAGAYGSYGDKTKGPKVAVYFSSVLKDAIDTQVPDVLGHVRTIMEGTQWWTLFPCNELLFDCLPEEVFCLADPGREYVVYFTVGQDVTLDLTHTLSDEVGYRWFNPRTGEQVDEGTLAMQPEKRRSRELQEARCTHFTPPNYVDDWVLIVRTGQDATG